MKQQIYLLLSCIITITLFFACTKKRTDTKVASINGISVLSADGKPQIQIDGAGFGNDANAVRVWFNQKDVSIKSIQDNKMIVELARDDERGRLQVEVNNIAIPDGPIIDLTLKVGLYAGIHEKEGYKDGPAAKAEFGSGGFGIAVDKQNVVYIADQKNHCIRKIVAGVVSTFAGNGQPGYADGLGPQARFYHPTEMSIDSKGNLYVSDEANDRIRRITPQGMVSTYAGSGLYGQADGPSSIAQIGSVGGMCVDAQDNLYFTSEDRIRKITPIGLLRFVSTVTGSDQEPGFINGTLAQARFDRPRRLVFDAQGNLFVADADNNAIRKITPAGVVSTFCGGTEGFLDATGTNARFYFPTGMAIDASGNIFVSDMGNNRIRKVSPATKVVTYAGNGNQGYKNGPALQAEFKWLEVIGINSYGALFVGEAGTQIRKIFW